MSNENLDTTNKLIKPEDISSSDDEVIRQLSDNLQDITPEDVDAMCAKLDEALILNKMKGDRETVLKYIEDNHVTREITNIGGISGDIININLPKFGDFLGFDGKYFISHKNFELWSGIFGLKEKGGSYVGREKSGLKRGNPMPDILEKCASMEEILDLAKAIQGFMKCFEINEDIRDEGHEQSRMRLSSCIGFFLGKIFGLSKNHPWGCYYWLRDINFFNCGSKTFNTFTRLYVCHNRCLFDGDDEIGDGGYLLWSLGKRSNLSTAEGLNKFGLSDNDYSIMQQQNNKL